MDKGNLELTNYIQLKDKAQNKGEMLYMDGRPKTTGYIAWFINSTQPGSTLKQPNCIFESHEGNHVFVCSIKSIASREELLTNYNLNHVDTTRLVWLWYIQQFTKPFINYFNIYRIFC